MSEQIPPRKHITSDSVEVEQILTILGLRGRAYSKIVIEIKPYGAIEVTASFYPRVGEDNPPEIR